MLKKHVLIVGMLVAAACSSANLAPPAKATGNVIVSHYGYYEPIFQIYYVFGEVRNIGDAPVTNITITASFYDSSNAFINSSKTYILPGLSDYVNPWVLMPGAKAPFWPIMLWNYSGSPSVNHYDVTVSKQECASIPVGLQLTLGTAKIVSGSLHVTGTVRNTGTSNSSFVYVYATAYDSNGVAIGYGVKSKENFAPNEVFTFDISAQNWIVTGTPRQVVNYTITAQSFIETGTFTLWAAQYTVTSDINEIIPEFPSALATVLLIMAITATLIFYKRKQI